jgi:hypothetical protein
VIHGPTQLPRSINNPHSLALSYSFIQTFKHITTENKNFKNAAPIINSLLLLLLQSFASAGVVPAGLPGGAIGNPDTQPHHPQLAQDPGPGLPGLSLPSSIPGPADNGQLGCTYCGSSHGSSALVSLRIRGFQFSRIVAKIEQLDCTTHVVKAWCSEACIHTEDCIIV